MIQDLTVRLLTRERLSPDAHLLWFDSGSAEPGIFRAGQFTMVQVPGVGLLRRPYSYCDRRGDGGFALLIKEVGLGTRALANLDPDTEVRCLGPLGTSFTVPEPDESPVIVAGGVGIAPFVAFCRDLAESGRSAVVLLGGRSERDLYLRDEFEVLGMDVRLATEDGSSGTRGRVTELLPPVLGSLERPRLYSCGPDGMLRRVAEMAAELGLPHEVSVERRMGCGMGCCLGCVVLAEPVPGAPAEYVHSCTAGPVMNADQIRWDTDPHPL